MTKKKEVTNTSKTLEKDPLMLLDMGLFGGTGGAIIEQEKDGQRELVDSTQLPSEIQSKDKWESLGFVFGELCPDDPIFLHAKLPEGWSKKTTSHALHSDLVDDKGRARGGIFYKAAFYDRRASMSAPKVRYFASPKFFFDDESVDDNTTVEWQVVDRSVKVGEDHKVIFSSRRDNLDRDSDRHSYYKADDKCRDDARNFLDQNYPDHTNPTAYWD